MSFGHAEEDHLIDLAAEARLEKRPESPEEPLTLRLAKGRGERKPRVWVEIRPGLVHLGLHQDVTELDRRRLLELLGVPESSQNLVPLVPIPTFSNVVSRLIKVAHDIENAPSRKGKKA